MFRQALTTALRLHTKVSPTAHMRCRSTVPLGVFVASPVEFAQCVAACHPPVSSQRHPSTLSSSGRESLTRGWPRSLSFSTPSLPETMGYLRNLQNGCEIYLVGTAHISPESAEEVREVIRMVEPGTVFVELCPERARKLMADQPASSALVNIITQAISPQTPAMGRLLQMFYSLLRIFGLDPGREFKVAIEEALKRNAQVVYGDQDASITMERLQAVFIRLSWSEIFSSSAKVSADSPLHINPFKFKEEVERMKTREAVREMMQTVHPDVVRVIRDERDEIMVERLMACNGKVVAVIGIGHLEGIEQRWADMMGDPSKLC